MEKSIDALASKINSRSAPNRHAKCRETSTASSYPGDPPHSNHQLPIAKKKTLPGSKDSEGKYRRFTDRSAAYLVTILVHRYRGRAEMPGHIIGVGIQQNTLG